MRKLNLGCGKDYKKGWVNVDFDKNVKADEYFDLAKPFPLKKSGFDYILLQDVLEHFTKEAAKSLLKECRKVLSVRGRIEIRVPDVLQIIKQFKKDPGVMIEFIYGHVSDSSEFQSHKYGYTVNSLKRVLKSAGFNPVSVRKETTNTICIAEKVNTPIYQIKVLISGQDSGGLGGAEKFTGDLAKSLTKKKVKVFFTAYAKSRFTKKLKSTGFKVWEIPVRVDIIGDLKGLVKFFLFLPLIIWKDLLILAKFKRNGGDVLILTGISDKILLTPIAKIFSIDVVWIEFAPLGQVFRKNFNIPKILYRLVKNIPKLVIVPTENTKKHLIPETRISETKIKVISCGIELIDSGKRQRIMEEKEKTKKELGIGKKRIIGMVSRIEKGKGQDTLIKAASLLNKKPKDFVIVIVGEGDIVHLKKLAERYNVGEKILFLGFRENLFEIMSTFDIFAFPSRWELEGFGLVLVEAMMMGIPVVAGNFGPIPEVVGGAACLVGPEPKDVAYGINKVLSSPKYASELVKKGHKRVNMFDINKVAEKYLEEIKNICAIHRLF